MLLLKFELFSPCATFKVPLSLKGIETYPLPPPSTIIGLLYTAAGRKWKGERFSLSIQGDFESIFRDYIRMRKYNRKDKELSPLPLEVPRLYNFRAVIHVSAEEKGLLKDFLEALKSPSRYLYLGGGEYPVLVKGVKITEAEHKDISQGELKMNAFVPERAKDILYEVIQFRVSTFCRRENGERVCDWINVYYAQKGADIGGKVLIDEEGDTVWLLDSM